MGRKPVDFLVRALLLVAVSTAAAVPAEAQFPAPYPVFGLPPYPLVHPGDPVVTLRLQIMPRTAIVYVDGYAAGTVDDYDGVFQRLRLWPGHHEVVVYLRGYRPLRQALYFNPGSTHTIRETLAPLAAGEAQEPPPLPRPIQPVPVPPPGGVWSSPGTPFGAPTGTLTLRVQPADANIYIDEELWRAPVGQDRLVVELNPGSHRVRVDKPGLQPFTSEVDVRAGETATLNVSLSQ